MRLSAVEDATNEAQEIDERESWRMVRDADRDVTGTKVIAYLVGTLTLVAGVSLLVLGGVIYENLLLGGWISGVSLTVAGVMAIPALRWRIESRLDVYLSSRTVVGIYLALVVGGAVVAPLVL